MKTEIAASKFLHRLAVDGVIVTKLCVVITLIVAFSSPSWASENAQSKHDRRHFTYHRASMDVGKRASEASSAAGHRSLLDALRQLVVVIRRQV